MKEKKSLVTKKICSLMTSDFMADKLDVLVGKETCPVCGTISQKGTARCPECGTFHSGIHLEEREAPSPEERISSREVDPGDYSMNPEVAIADEEFEGDDTSIKNWVGGSTDFSFIDDEVTVAVKSSMIEVPLSEEIEAD